MIRDVLALFCVQGCFARGALINIWEANKVEKKKRVSERSISLTKKMVIFIGRVNRWARRFFKCRARLFASNQRCQTIQVRSFKIFQILKKEESAMALFVYYWSKLFIKRPTIVMCHGSLLHNDSLSPFSLLPITAKN